jgi:NADPH:quinone reductase-like Zn-dependent oxidoreductase
MKTMKAVRIHSYGGPDVLVYGDTPRPRPGDGEALVHVHATAINSVDWQIRAGRFRETCRHRLPLVLGWDVSGVVEGLGPGLTRLKIGDEVFSSPNLFRDGAYAEFVVIREAEVALKPRSVDHIHAAALPFLGLTAWQSLFEAAGLTVGQRVLIHAADEGVGSLAVQLAKWRGAYVVGTALSQYHSLLRGLGVDQVVDAETARFEETVSAVDIVLDTQGGEIQERSWKTLKRGGILVSIASPPSSAAAKLHGVRHSFVIARPDAKQLAEIALLVEADKINAPVETILSLAEAPRGHELSERGHVRGKIVLRVASAGGDSGRRALWP